jgi:hypothetical protein
VKPSHSSFSLFTCAYALVKDRVFRLQICYSHS